MQASENLHNKLRNWQGRRISRSLMAALCIWKRKQHDSRGHALFFDETIARPAVCVIMDGYLFGTYILYFPFSTIIMRPRRK